MIKYFFSLFYFILFTTSIIAQSQTEKTTISNKVFFKDVIITGKVVDKDSNQPLEYATISFFSKLENKIETGGITDVNGNFSIPVKAGVYDISIEYFSFKTITITNRIINSDENIGTFYLEINLEALETIEVIAERTTVEVRLDKKIYNVGKDLTVSGGTVSDVLDNVPSVSVDAEGNVALRGNQNVKILINGKPSGLVGLNSTDALRQLPAESIEKVEVITSPSARYESEGTAGILNIILRRSKLQGFNGAITANVGDPISAGISENVNYRTGDINFFNTTGYSYRESPGHSYTFTKYKADGNYLDEKRDWLSIRKGLTTNLGLEWYINDSASLTTSLVYRNSDNERNSTNKLLQFDENLILTGESIRLDPELEDDKTIQYSVNFTKNFKTNGHELSFDFQYEDSNEDQNSLVVTDGLASDKVQTLQDQQGILLQSDYVLPIGENNQFELGYRGKFDTTITDYSVELLNLNTNNFEIDNNLSNIFNFKSYINAVYTQYGSKINKFTYLLGLRMENTQITIDQPTSGDFKKKNYTGLFPTVNLNFELSEDENITLGYGRRLGRPHSHHLNPFPSRSSLTNYFQGNPDLDPTYSGKFDVGYLNRYGKFNLSTSLYFEHSKNVINWVTLETGETVIINGQDIEVLKRTPINFATNDRYGFEFNLNYNPTKKWRMNTDFNFFKSITKGDFNNVNYDADNLSWMIRFSNKYSLPGKIDWQTNINCRGPSEDSQNKRKGTYVVNMAFSKDLFKEKASIAFNISDIFDSRKYRSETNTETFFSTSDLQFRGGRNFNLSFTYRFNQKKKQERQNRGGGEGFDFEG